MRKAAWDAYEQAVMAGRGEDADPPGADYVMSDEFRQWLMGRLRTEVLGEVARGVQDLQPRMRRKA